MTEKELSTNGYTPRPVDTSDIELSPELLKLAETLARNVHDVWAVGRLAQGWTYGPMRDDSKLQTPCLVPYDKLKENEKEFDRNTSIETLKVITKLGFKITR